MSQPRMDGGGMSCARRAFEEFSAFMADHAHAAPRRVSVPGARISAQCRKQEGASGVGRRRSIPFAGWCYPGMARMAV
jgi:hypothetical protein